MQKKILEIITETPLHIGAGSSVGVIDMPIIRERHTRFPVIPGTALKGVLADFYIQENEDSTAKEKFIRDEKGRWLFGEEEPEKKEKTDNEDKKEKLKQAAGALLIGEARLLAFPVRSAKGAFAWVTSPLALTRYFRDKGKDIKLPPSLKDDECFAAVDIKISDKIVLEEYTFTCKGDFPKEVIAELENVFLNTDPVWKQHSCRMVMLSDGMMSYFAENACEVATRIRVNDFTGTVDEGALFNQENVPSETLFYAVIHARDGKSNFKEKKAAEAIEEIKKNLNGQPLQIGGDASTGHGWCRVNLA